MARLEDLKEGAKVKGIRPDGPVTIINVKWHGDSVVEVAYKDSSGQPGNELIFRDKELTLEIVEAGQSWSFDADASMLRLVSEAYRIRMAYLFDPLLAVHTSMIEPLPHQITAVYQEMLPRQPLRYLLADDPGAGKTIMAGLLIKELMVRGDFEILTNDRLEAARTGNAFQEIPLLIARLDKLSRDEKAQAKLKQTEWDLIICDEAHKMSASFFAGEIKETKRRKLGRLLSTLTRHFLLMTATPHNGKEEDFQLFMALLDGDRFEGRFRDGVHVTDVSDLMRRMVKEELVKFDGTPLFPERLAYTVTYPLSDQEAILYERVTNYVREEFNRADALENEGRRGTVGFALTILQRRLASSPEAIYQSLKRRRERLESRLREEELLRRGAEARIQSETWAPPITEEELEDLDDATDKEVQEAEEQILDLATAAQTISELRAEIGILKELKALALQVRRSGQDRKWEELEKERQLSPLPPVVKGGAFVVPGGLIARLKGKRQEEPELFARETRRVEQIAMQAVMDVEKSLGYVPRDVSQDNCRYDIESAIPGTGKLRFIEVKGRLEGAKTVTITKNEILTALNKPDDFILAVVLVPPSDTAPQADPWKIEDPARNYGNIQNDCQVYYIRKPFTQEPDFGVTSVNYDLGELLANAEKPFLITAKENDV